MSKTKQGNRWTAPEEAHLRERYAVDGPAAVSEHLGRTKSAVWAKAAMMGVRKIAKKSEWSGGMDAYMRERYDGTVSGRVSEIQGVLGLTRAQVRQRAVRLGLTRSHRKWSREDEAFLWAWIGRKPVTWVARKLKRSVSSVKGKTQQLGLRRRIAEGYTRSSLQECFGVCEYTLTRWVRQGLLRVSKRGTAHAHDPWQATDSQVLRFIREHPLEFDLRKVDQTWFMDLITNGGLIRDALKTEIELEAA